MNASISVVCYRSKTLSSGEHPLMLQITKDYKRKYKSLGVSVKPSHWDFKKNRLKSSCPNYDQILKLTFYLIGINTKDLFFLELNDNNVIEYKRFKTSKIYTFRIGPEAYEILHKYSNESGMLVFQKQFKHYTSFRRKVNDYLKEITTGVKYKSPKEKHTEAKPILPRVTTYTLRHTWATIAADLDIPIETIAAALGHSDDSVTDIYINFNRKKIDEANRKVIDYVLQVGEFKPKEKTKKARKNK